MVENNPQPATASPGNLQALLGSAPSASTFEDPVDSMIHAALGRFSGGFSPLSLAQAWFDWGIHLAVSPARMAELSMQAIGAVDQLLDLASAMARGRKCEPCKHSLPQDKRFRSPAWSEWPFAFYAESFLAAERWWDEATSKIHGATRHDLAMLNFVGRQALDCVAPSNFVLINPDVLQQTIDDKGANLVRGLQYAVKDLQRLLENRRPLGAEKFHPGKTVAQTAGKVVYRTRLAEIIQYTPTTETVRPEPVVIVPAWIMKYYILDLRPENSLVKYLVDQGFMVFVISWKNPAPEDRDIGFDDYRLEGILPALGVAGQITGARRVHLAGYCIGGTLAGIAAATMARDLDGRLASLTLFAAQTDFKEAGELKLFVDESQLAILDDIMWEQGNLTASQMAGTFSLLRSNDLIWSRLINHYLLGQREEVSDIAAWSSDATRLPYRMHSEYLRGLYLNNDLAEGRYIVDGKAIALQDIRLPLFAVGAEWDHVAPWQSVYKLHLLTEADITFVLTNGGHNQGIISPPGRVDRHYRIAATPQSARHVDPKIWLERAAYREGSWWPEWGAWLAAHSGQPVAPPPLGKEDAGIRLLGDAPGTYVLG